MAYITGQTEQGNCSTVYWKDGWYECAPVPTEACVLGGEINSWHCWFAEVNGTVGEEVNVHLNWPEADYSKMRPELQAQNYRSIWENFARCAQDAIYVSYDRKNWQRIEDVTLAGQQLAFSVTLEEKRCWLSVTLYYTPERYGDLLAAVKGHPKIRTLEIGTDFGGDKIYAFEATDYSVSAEEKIPVLLMAGYGHVVYGCHAAVFCCGKRFGLRASQKICVPSYPGGQCHNVAAGCRPALQRIRH